MSQRLVLASTVLVCGGLVAAVSIGSAKAEPPVWFDQEDVVRITMTADQLREAGIAVASAGVAPLPNSCTATGSPELSVSNEMLAAFKTRGFTLESLCLGFVSSFNFDPDTGKPIPFAAIEKGMTIPLNLPNCFKRAVPFLDCTWGYDQFWGVKEREEILSEYLEMSGYIESRAQGRINKVGPNGIEDPSDGCSNGTGTFAKQFQGRTVCIMLSRVVFSPKFPLGYGYAFRHPEGNDPEEDKTNLSTYGKKIGATPLWYDKTK